VKLFSKKAFGAFGVAAALKTIYDTVDDKAAETALTAFENGPWGQKYQATPGSSPRAKAWRRA